MAVSPIEELRLPDVVTASASPSRRPPLLDWLSCVGFGNLALVRVWTDVLSISKDRFASEYGPPAAHDYGAAIVLSLLLGTALFILLKLVRNRLFQAAVVLAVVAFVAKAGFMLASNVGVFDRGNLLFWLRKGDGIWEVLAAPAAVAFLIIRAKSLFHGLGMETVRFAAPATVPIALFTIASAAWRLPGATEALPGFFDRNVSPEPARKRLVWIVFDSLDEEVAFSKRLPGVSLPSLDRFRREASFVALHARASSDSTSISIPSIVGGRHRESFDLQPAGTVFARAHAAGLRIGIAGWALPYCRALSGVANTCAWWPMPRQLNSFGSDLQSTVYGQFRSLFETNLFSPFGPSLSVLHHNRTIKDLTAYASTLAARSDLDFVFLHLIPPHGPFVYDPATGTLGAAKLRAQDYASNLVLADSIFSGIRTAMEEAYVWDDSTVLITADHGFRSRHLLGYEADNLRVPFLLKTSSPVKLDASQPFSTLRAGDVALEAAFGIPPSS